jgi:hypothetical protein
MHCSLSFCRVETSKHPAGTSLSSARAHTDASILLPKSGCLYLLIARSAPGRDKWKAPRRKRNCPMILNAIFAPEIPEQEV